ncbi:uncharacterized protein EI90DRAFT_2949750 [Cantharellus anzutake]|uniref:uncharacterized protein n=1 Tax=Cantharellus anzutake TaxID=1750568 RepID=UPI001906F2AA|nr:uncharacterized protein EI90DRAFT_2949750 [Cantharellus anzutake]KAF8313519.1 hypothetical protein EI90DRAFT_2949750 [Cantharellus anzutake]
MLGCLPLVSDMPVMVGENFNVKGRIVNGSEGHLKHIRYENDKAHHALARSAVVTIPDSAPLAFLDLPPHDCVILPKPISIKVTHPISNRTLMVK